MIRFGFVCLLALAPGVTRAEVGPAIDHGVAFLVGYQNADGSWGSPRQTKALNVLAPVPGTHRSFQAASTALCLEALYETGFEREGVEPAFRKGVNWLIEQAPSLRRGRVNVMNNVWGYAFGLQVLAKVADDERFATDRVRILESMAKLVAQLETYESVNGGWGYYDNRSRTYKPGSDSNTFITATVLLALLDAREAGVEIPEQLLTDGLKLMTRLRKKDFTYLYSFEWRNYPMRGINRPASNLGRSQVCNLVMREMGDASVTDEVLVEWLDRLVKRNGWLDIGRKRPIPHEAWFEVAGYFYLYGHYYAARCIEALPEGQRPRFQKDIGEILTGIQEKDGSWWDFPLYDYHKPYGTAFALMALQRCRLEKKP